jgi:hypothetical protein
MPESKKADAKTKRDLLIAEMIAESLAGPYVHEECGDTMWDDALAEHAAKEKAKTEKT